METPAGNDQKEKYTQCNGDVKSKVQILGTQTTSNLAQQAVVRPIIGKQAVKDRIESSE